MAIRDILTPPTTRQRLIVWAWIAVVVAAGVYPPWTLHEYSAGYHLIFAPPHGRAMHVDQSRLTIEWILCTVIAAGLYFVWPVLRTRPRRPPAPAPKPPPIKREGWWSRNSFMTPVSVVLAVLVLAVLTSLIPGTSTMNVSAPATKPADSTPDFAEMAKKAGLKEIEPQERAAPDSAQTAAVPAPDYDKIAAEHGGRDITEQAPTKVIVEPIPFLQRLIYTRPALAPNRLPWPTQTGYLRGCEQLNKDGESLATIDNRQTMSDMLVKLFDHRTDRLIRIFFLRAGDTFTMKNVSPGEYDIRYKNLDTGLNRESEPVVLAEHTEERRGRDGPELWAIGTTFELPLHDA
jgi:hypothetical protein